MKQLVPWLCCAFLTVSTLTFAAAFFAADRYGDKQHRQVEAFQRFHDDQQARLLPVPSLASTSVYGAPYNLTIKCEVAGSSEGQNGSRVPLDVDGGPRVGDVYVKTCTAR